MPVVSCTNCGNEMHGDASVASMSGSILGDECTESFFLCERCDCYTVTIFWSCFSGTETSSVKGPLTKQDGERQVDLIRKCAEPWNKKCRCDAHCSYFDGMLD